MPAWSSRMSPEAGLEPAVAEPAVAAEVADRQRRRARCEPAGSSIVTSTDPAVARSSQERSFGALTSSRPSAYSTRVCSAALTSSSLDASLGRTSTTVSVRSLGGDPDVADGEVDRGGDRFGGVEGRHGVPPVGSGSKTRGRARSAHPAGVARPIRPPRCRGRLKDRSAFFNHAANGFEV